MPLSDEAKQVLRERLKIAREAKEAKKSRVKEATKEVVSQPPPAPVIQPQPIMAVPTPLVVDATAPRDAPITTKVERHTKNHDKLVETNKPVKPLKTKYAKLVFYSEPTSNKKIKKLTKVLEQSSDSDSEDQDFAHVEPKTQPTMDRQLQYNKISHLSKAFFD